jgi:CHAD domain-containing protein
LAKAPSYEGLTADTPLGEAARIVLAALWSAVLAPQAAVLGGDDARAVHDMRVAVRRLRSAMVTFSERFPRKRWRALRAATRRLGRRLGDVRDADVHLAALRAARGESTLDERAGIDYAIETLATRRRRALAEFAIELSQFDHAAFQEALDLA